MRVVLILAVLVGCGLLTHFMAAHHAAGDDVFLSLYGHVLPTALELHHHPIGIPLPGFLSPFTLDEAGHATGQLTVYNLQVFQIGALLLIAICFLGVPQAVRTGHGDLVSRLFAGFALWVREEMVVPVMGRSMGNRFLPFFLTLFFFIVFMNLLGLVPGGATATASIGVTAALALVSLCAMIGCGMAVQGPLKFWVNLVPHGLPLWLVPVLFVVEVIGLMVKPVALTIRLFANMTGGHLVVLSAMGLIYLAGAAGPAMGYAVAPGAIGFAVFIMIIEAFVALLQAYIFTYLSILFVQMCIHPEH